ncbi:lipoyl(octanoyl) transferase LipB [Gammaproteobacteria bacterium]|nr:lipoyl(octanoyl) transferase LipB [Gammaproteobacteria bacterium]
MTEIKFKELGVVEYTETHDAMMQLIESQPSFHSIWSLEHFPVFTIGISEKEITEDRSKSPPFIKTDRGGKTTFHAPGQLVIYFILNMKNLPFPPTELTKKILETASMALASYDLKHNISARDPGIFINDQKVASIGMRIKKNYSYHGLSINVETDLNTFNSIKPCGLDVQACNLKDYININVDVLKKELLNNFQQMLCK